MRSRLLALWLFVVMGSLVLSTAAYADNQYFIIGHGGSSNVYSGMSHNTYAYPWSVSPTGLHVSSGWVIDTANNYCEAGLDDDGTGDGMFIAYEDYPRTGSIGNQQLVYRVPVTAGLYYRFRIENTLQPPYSSWDVYCDGTRIITGKYFTFDVGNVWSTEEHYYASDDSRAWFNLLRRKWSSDQSWHDWTTLYFSDNDPYSSYTKVSNKEWYSD